MNVRPRNYTIEFEPDFSGFTFKGVEKITMDIAEQTDAIILHAADLHIHSCRSGKQTLKFKLDEKEEKLIISLPKKSDGQLIIDITFTGKLNDKLIGFYRSEYKDDSGAARFLATTQFEAADARRAFPCIDEPRAKATFDITLIVDKQHTAISNMPIQKEYEKNDKKVVIFAQSPIMSTYLLYMGVGEFEYIAGKYKKVDVRIVTTKGKKEQGALALDLTKKFLNFFDDYFGIPYPLPKLDMIAIPDFASGAMENWGAITYRETMLLYEEKTSSQQTKEEIAEVIAHELAHQWFGNLVTMQWWNDLWLNESFATFMATKAANHFFPEWDLWDQFLKSATADAMALDSLESSHPINVDVKSPAEVREIFDSISYDKGGSLLRMLENYVGEKHFQKGLNAYLTEHKYANATTHDLWNAIGKAAAKPVDAMMNTWVNFMGYPQIEVERNSAVTLRQHRFLLSGKKIDQLWAIPISIQTAEGRQSLLLSSKETKIRADGWIKVNSDQKGFYRVKYPAGDLKQLKARIETKSLNNVDRWGLQHDLFAQVIRGDIGLSSYLSFVESYAKDEDYLSSSDVAGALYMFYVVSAGQPCEEKIKDYDRKYFTEVFRRLGWNANDKEKTTNKLFRGFVISVLGRLGDTAVLSKAKLLFDESDKKAIDPNLRSSVYGLVAWGADRAAYEKLKRLYKTTRNHEEKLRFLVALCNTKDQQLLKETLEFSLTKEIRSQDLVIPITVVANNPYGKSLIWPWMKENWGSISSKFGIGNPLLNRAIGSLSIVTDPKIGKDIEEFFRKNPIPGTERKIAQTLEKIGIYSMLIGRMNKEL